MVLGTEGVSLLQSSPGVCVCVCTNHRAWKLDERRKELNH